MTEQSAINSKRSIDLEATDNEMSKKIKLEAVTDTGLPEPTFTTGNAELDSIFNDPMLDTPSGVSGGEIDFDNLDLTITNSNSEVNTPNLTFSIETPTADVSSRSIETQQIVSTMAPAASSFGMSQPQFKPTPIPVGPIMPPQSQPINSSLGAITFAATIPPDSSFHERTVVNGLHPGTAPTGALPPPVSDPSKLSDVLVSAGVDLRQEEELLNSTSITRTVQYKSRVETTPFIDPRQIAPFIRKVAYNNGIRQSFDNEHDILNLVTFAVNERMSQVVTKAVLLSRHRRRGIKPTTGRSDISKALKDVATKQKEDEEKRVQKRIALGIESADGDGQKAGAEETLHRATNATVAMMTSSKKKKYSWMTGSTAPGAGATRSNSVLANRGDSGIRYREARQEQGVVLRDLLAALEDEKQGVEKSLMKGYAKLRD